MTATTPPPSVLTGRHIRLEPLSEDDLPELFGAIGVPEVFAGGFGAGPLGYRDNVEDFVNWGRGYFSWGRNIVYGVRLSGGELVGTSTLGDFDETREHAHIGWTAYHPSVWAGPVNPEAKLLLLGHAFANGFGRVKLQADSLNERSRAAILKLGAQFEGIVRRDQLRPDGIWRSTAVYSILKDEWPDVRAGLQERLAAFESTTVTLATAPRSAAE